MEDYYNQTTDDSWDSPHDLVAKTMVLCLVACSLLGGLSRCYYSSLYYWEMTAPRSPQMRTRLTQLENYLLSTEPCDSPKADKETCCICIEPLEEQQITIQLKCNHIFHKDCILQWLQKELTCPICRRPLN